MSNPLVAARNAGQSLWLDFIQRSMMSNGALDKLITDDQILGITSNPSIFEAAIANTDEYDQQISELLAQQPDLSAMDIFKQLAITDIAAAADRFAPIYGEQCDDQGARYSGRGRCV